MTCGHCEHRWFSSSTSSTSSRNSTSSTSRTSIGRSVRLWFVLATEKADAEHRNHLSGIARKRCALLPTRDTPQCIASQFASSRPPKAGSASGQIQKRGCSSRSRPRHLADVVALPFLRSSHAVKIERLCYFTSVASEKLKNIMGCDMNQRRCTLHLLVALSPPLHHNYSTK